MQSLLHVCFVLVSRNVALSSAYELSTLVQVENRCICLVHMYTEPTGCMYKYGYLYPYTPVVNTHGLYIGFKFSADGLRALLLRHVKNSRFVYFGYFHFVCQTNSKF